MVFEAMCKELSDGLHRDQSDTSLETNAATFNTFLQQFLNWIVSQKYFSHKLELLS